MKQMSVKTVDRHYLKIMIACAATLVVLMALALLASEPVLQFLTHEGGPIETFSAAGYVLAIVSLYRELGADYVKNHFYFALVPAAMCMREMDFHVHFTTISITKSSFYVSSEVPLLEKVVVVALLLFLIWAGYLMVRRHGAAFLQGLRRADVVAIAIAAAGFCAVASKGFDGIGRKLGEWGIAIAASSEIVALVLEEVLELGIPLFMVAAIFAYSTRTKRISL